MQANLDDYRWLLQEAGPFFEQVDRDEPLHAQIRRLRGELTAAKAHLVLEQIELRRRARLKFRDPTRMFFTRRSLEQASEEAIADYKAARLGGGRRVADLCCGMGGDLIAFGRLHQVSGVDRDPLMTMLAAANAAAFGISATLLEADAEQVDLAEFDAFHIDPDRRRNDRQRTVHAEAFEPDAEQLQGLFRRCAESIVKVAPASPLPEQWAGMECEREWIGSRGETRQQLIWRGERATSVTRRATIVDAPQPRSAGDPSRRFAGDDGTAAGANRGETPTSTPMSTPMSTIASIDGSPDVDPPRVLRPLRYLYDTHSVVLASRLVGEVAVRNRLAALGGYLTGDDLVVSPFLSAFRVQDVLPLDRKRLRRHLRESEFGPLEIKKRGVAVEPEALRRWLKLRGERKGVLLLTEVEGRQLAVVAEREQG